MSDRLEELNSAVQKTADYLYNIKGDVEPELYQAIATLRQLINEEFKPEKSISSQFIYDILNPAINTSVAEKIIEARKDELHKLGKSFLTEKGLMWCISRMQELRDEALNHKKENS